MRCVVLVALTESNKDVQVGTYEGEDTSIGRLEGSAKATLRALESAAEHRVEFDLDLPIPGFTSLRPCDTLVIKARW